MKDKLNINQFLLKKIIYNEKYLNFKELYFISENLNKYEILQQMF